MGLTNHTEEPQVTVEDRVTIDPAVRGGKPCIKGTRITVYDLLEYLAGGMSEEQILLDFPSLVLDDIRAALAFAANRERRLASSLTELSFSTPGPTAPRVASSIDRLAVLGHLGSTAMASSGRRAFWRA